MRKINTAVVLCAGFGKRLSPLTDKIPKPLLKINNITLLENTLNLIKTLGIEKVLINTFYLKKYIEDFINNKKFDLNIKIIEEKEIILDTGGGTLNLIKNTEENDFISFNPDTFWSKKNSNEILSMESLYLSKSIKNILMVVNKNKSFDKKLKGDFLLNSNKLLKSDQNEYIYTGCQIFNRSIFSGISEKVFSMSNIWNNLEKKNELYGYESKKIFKHITNIQIYEELLKNY
tara:strand:+ start:1377 stop:2072 length:696 start_codon:yes stop_codon:yes gene_type:complete